MTVAVTVRLICLTDETDVAGRRVTVSLDKTQRTAAGFVVASEVSATTDVNGVCVFHIPSDFQYTFRCEQLGWRCTATIPITDCELHQIADL